MSLELRRLSERLYQVVGERDGRFPRSHSFYVDDDISVLIDTGCGIPLLKELARTRRIDYVINSHGHPDHSAGNWVLPDTPLVVPSEGAATHGRLKPLSERFAEPGRLARRWRAYIRKWTGFRDRVPTDLYHDGQTFKLGRTNLQAIHTPGHTADHYCLFEEESGVLLSFDIDLTPFGPWYGHRESSLRTFRVSIERVRELEPALIASSHREPVRGGAIDEELDRYLEVMAEREAAILELIGRGATFEALVEASPIYRGKPFAPDILGYWEGRMIRMHLDELMTRRAVILDGDVYVRL